MNITFIWNAPIDTLVTLCYIVSLTVETITYMNSIEMVFAILPHPFRHCAFEVSDTLHLSNVHTYLFIVFEQLSTKLLFNQKMHPSICHKPPIATSNSSRCSCSTTRPSIFLAWPFPFSVFIHSIPLLLFCTTWRTVSL